MSKRKPYTEKEILQHSQNQSLNTNRGGILTNTKLHAWLIALFTFLLYANTLTHDYTQDDAIVIYDNMFTTQGVKGIPGILNNDTFFGFFKVEGKANLVAGGRYRPLTLVMFAIEWELFGKSPFMGHLMNIAWFALTCLMLYWLLLKLFNFQKNHLHAAFIAFSTAMLFAAHPIHTEAVANIKGRDEIMALLGSLTATFLVVKGATESKFYWTLAGAVVFFLSLFSKENTITFLAVIPLTLWFFGNVNFSKIITHTVPLVVATVVFLLIRGSIIGWQMGGTPMELMNNPFIKVSGNQFVPFSMEERFATILFTLGKYLQLLVFPHPLTHDYYPRHVGIMHFGDWQVIASLGIYLILTAYAIRGVMRRDVVSYGILFFLVTLSIVSNLLFPVGTNMSERFVFMPSVGFCLIVAVLAWRLVAAKGGKPIEVNLVNKVLGIMLVLAVLFGMKTIVRNAAWKDNFTLFLTDVKTSVNSAKLQNAAGGELITQSIKVKDDGKRQQMLHEAVEHLKVAIKIHPTYTNAYLLLGNAFNYLKDYEQSIQFFEHALKIDPNFKDAQTNLTITYRDAGRYYGEEKGDLPKALAYLNKSYEMNPAEYETTRLLGVAYGIAGDNAKAIEFFTKGAELNPKSADAWYNLGSAYHNAGDPTHGIEFHQKAIQMDPEVVKRMEGKK